MASMLSKQELANPALRLAQGAEDPGDVQPPPVTPDRAASRTSTNASSERSSTFVWLENVATTPARITSLSTTRGTSGTRTPNTASRRPSYDTGDEDNDFYSLADESSAPTPGAVRVPGLHGSSTASRDDDMTIALPAPVDPYHHVVAQAVDDTNSENEDLRRRVTNLEQDLRRSYMLLSVQTSQAAPPIAPLAPSADGSDTESHKLRTRLLQLEQQLLSQSQHAPSERASPPQSETGFSTAAAGSQEMLVTAPSSHVVVATVADGVVDAEMPLNPPSRAEQHVRETASSDDSSSKMPTGAKCLLFLLLLGGIGTGAYFAIEHFFLSDDSTSDKALPLVDGSRTPTTSPVMIGAPVEPTVSPSVSPACPSIDNWFLNESPLMGLGSLSRTYTVDCGVIRDVSALEIDPISCEPKCSFLLQRFSYDDLCDENNTFAFNVNDDKYTDSLLVLGYLGENANFTCGQAEKYVLPDPSPSPSAPPSPEMSSTPTSSPTCSAVGVYFDGAQYSPVDGGIDTSFSLGCGPNRDIGILVRNEATCGVECVGRLPRTTYGGVCQVDSVVEFTLNGDYRSTQVLVGYLEENAALNCDADLVFETPSPTEEPTPAPEPTAQTPDPTPPPTSLTPQPTPPPTPDGARLEQLLDLYGSSDPTSPSYQAITWLALQDTRGLPIEDTWDLAERYALATLYFATNGNTWDSDARWLSGDSQCVWRGVTCDGDDRITQLDLSNNDLRGPLVADLGELRRLERLELQRNRLEGRFPTQLGRLTSLTTLEISDNQIGGEIPTHIGRMTSLTDLQLHNNAFTGEIPTQISELRVLRRFACEYNQLVGTIPSQLGSLRSLANIYLGHNDLVGTIPRTFGNLGQLTLLSLSANEISGPLPDELAQLTLMTRLSCSQNEISSTIPREFESWTSLTYLSLWGNRLTGTIPDELSRWTELENIYIDGNQFSGGIDNLCNSNGIFEFYTDCDEDGCECCTFCCDRSDCVEVV